MRDSYARLADVLEAIERIEERVVGGRIAFDHDDLLQVWVLHHLQIIGEACRAVPAGFRDAYPEVNWKRVIGMRHILVHHYFEIDREVVWLVVENELASLKSAIRSILLTRPPQ